MKTEQKHKKSYTLNNIWAEIIMDEIDRSSNLSFDEKLSLIELQIAEALSEYPLKQNSKTKKFMEDFNQKLTNPINHRRKDLFEKALKQLHREGQANGAAISKKRMDTFLQKYQPTDHQ